MLELRHLSKSYVAGTPVLSDIDLEIAPRGVTAIIGASGTGKSTLIRCINRLVEPTAGEIRFDGVDLARLSGRALRHARRHIGMVFQEYNLVERLTVMENLLCGRLGYVSPWRAWRRKFPPEDIRRAYELLEVVGLARLRPATGGRPVRRPAPARRHRACGHAGAAAAARRRAHVVTRPEDVGRDHGAAFRRSRASAGSRCSSTCTTCSSRSVSPTG